MLLEYLQENQHPILDRAGKIAAEAAPERQSAAELAGGLQTFYEHLLLLVLQRGRRAGAGGESDAYARFLSDHGFLIDQVIKSYGSICQAVSVVALDRQIALSGDDYRLLNECLDEASAQAVIAFTERRESAAKTEEHIRLGSLAHELRNALSGALSAFDVARRGNLGLDGDTGGVLRRNLLRMSELIDRALSQVRIETEKDLCVERVEVVDIARDIEAMAFIEAQFKHLTLHLDIPAGLKVQVDRQLFVSAFSNLVKNAIKYTREGSDVWVRAQPTNGRVIVEVEDRCGGLPPGQAENLFEPFVQRSTNRTGAGLGLSVARRAISLLDGQLRVRNIPGTGCVFSIDVANAAAIQGEAH